MLTLLSCHGIGGYSSINDSMHNTKNSLKISLSGAIIGFKGTN